MTRIDSHDGCAIVRNDSNVSQQVPHLLLRCQEGLLQLSLQGGAPGAVLLNSHAQLRNLRCMFMIDIDFMHRNKQY